MSAINRNEERVSLNRQNVFLVSRRDNDPAAATYSYMVDAVNALYADRDAAEVFRRAALVPGSPEAIKQRELDDMMAWFAKYGCD